MPVELTIPAVGESITEVQISEWLKSEGDLVKQDETIAVIDSEKATLDLPCAAKWAARENFASGRRNRGGRRGCRASRSRWRGGQIRAG